MKYEAFDKHKEETGPYTKVRHHSHTDKEYALLRELALGGIWVERSYSPLPVEVVDADLTARTYAVGRTRRADT